MRTSFLRRLLLVAIVVAAPMSVAIGQPSVPLRRQEVRADDGQKLTLWEKRPTGATRGAILLLHGRTWGALPNFDLHAPGAHVSLMDAFAARGYAVYALDQRGYGSTPRDATGWLTPNRAELDVAQVLDWIAAQNPLNASLPVLLGYSRGSMTALLAAQRHAGKMSAVVLYAFPYDVTTTIVAIAEPRTPPREATTADGAAEDFITPSSTPDGVKDAYVKAATANDPVRVDWRHEEQFSVLDPIAVQTPTLLINGDRDPIATAASLPTFYSRLTVDRWWVVLASADHVAHLERQPEFVQAVVSFMERAGPTRR